MNAFMMLFKSFILSIIVLALASCGGADERKLKYLEKGKVYLEKNDLDKAKVEFKNVVQIDPKFAEAYYYFGRLEERKKELGKAISYYRKAVELDINYVAAKVRLAKMYLVVNTPEYNAKSNELLKAVFLAEPDNVEAKIVSATMDYKNGNKELAVSSLEKIVNADPKLTDAVDLLHILYLGQGDLDKAINVLKSGISDSVETTPLRVSLTKLYMRNNQFDLAESQMLKVVELSPDIFEYRVALSKFYSAIKQTEKARRVLEDAIKGDEDDAVRYLVLVDFIASTISVQDAETVLSDAIATKPGLYELKFALAKLYLKFDKIDDAKILLEGVIKDRSYDKEGVKARTELASIYLSEQNHEKSKELIDAVLKEYPNENDALLINAKLSIYNNDSLAAINGLRTVLKSQPTNADASSLLARAHEINNESSLAESVLKDAISSNPNDATTHINYAEYLISKKRINDADDLITKALIYFKDDFKVLDLKLRIAASMKSETDIVSVLDAMKMSFPDNGEVNIKRGQYQVSKQQYDDARNEFELALTKLSDKYRPLELIVKTFLLQKMPEKAIARINQRLATNADDVSSYFLLGKIHASSQDFANAQMNYKKAIAITPSWPAPYLSLGSLYVVNNKISDAIAIYKQAINTVKNPAMAQVQLASLYEKNNQYKEAIDVYESILKRNPSNKIIANNLVSLLIEFSTDTDTIARAKQLTQGFETLKQPAFLDTLGWLYVKAGEASKALPILTRNVELLPKIDVFKYHLGVALNDTGDKEGAKKYLKVAVESDQDFIGKDKARLLLDTL